MLSPFMYCTRSVDESKETSRRGKDWELKALEDGKTEFTLIHSGWDADKTTEFGQPHTVVRKIMDDGWENIVNQKLPTYLEG